MELIVFINFILTIYLLTKIPSKEQKLQGKKEISIGSQDQAITSLPQQESDNNSHNKIEIIDTPPSNKKSDADIFSSGFAWLREDWMLKLGGFFILLAAGWFVTFAFMNNWIGEAGRIVAGILSGSAFMFWGTLRMKKSLRQGEVILIIGSIILVTSVYSGQHLYNLYPELLSLASMTLVAIVISAIAFVNKREVLAVFGIFMVGISPLLAGYNSITPNVQGLLTYLLCMSLGVLWLSKVTGWKSVTFLVTIVVFVYIYPYFTQYYEYTKLNTTGTFTIRHYLGSQKLSVDADVLRFFAIVFSIIFNMSVFITLLFEKKQSRDDFVLVSVTAGFAAFSLFMLSTPDLLALKLAVVAIIFIILAGVLTKITKYSYYVELYATISILFLIAATLKATNNYLLPTILSAEAIVLTVFYRYVFEIPYPLASIIPYGGSFLISFGNLTSVGLTWQITIGFVSTLISTYFPFILSKIDKDDDKIKADSTISNISVISGNILASLGFYFFVGNIGNTMDFAPSLIKGIRYSVYAILGSFSYFTSRTGGHKIKYYFGIGFILYVVAALLFYEIWMMDIAARIVVYSLIGFLFISSIYFLKNYEK